MFKTFRVPLCSAFSHELPFFRLTHEPKPLSWVPREKSSAHLKKKNVFNRNGGRRRCTKVYIAYPSSICCVHNRHCPCLDPSSSCWLYNSAVSYATGGNCAFHKSRLQCTKLSCMFFAPFVNPSRRHADVSVQDS